MRRIVAGAGVLAALVLLVACDRGGKPEGSAGPSSTATTALPVPSIRFAVTPASGVESMLARAVGLPGDVVAPLDAWVAQGMVAPLTSGQPAAGLDASFTPVALARLAAGSPDSVALLEEPVAAGVEPEKASVTLAGLEGKDGVIAVVSASVDLSYVVVSPGSRVRVVRTGEVVLLTTPAGWRIDSFDVVTKRDTVL
jgi:hypothetical protein